MFRRFCLMTAMVCTATVLMATQSFADAFELNRQLGRAVNMGNMLEAPDEGEWGVYLREEYFDLIADAGFTGVRIPVRWSAHAEEDPPYAIDAEWMDRVQRAVDQALQRELVVVLNMHHYDEIFEDPDGHKDRFFAMWDEIAERFKDYPEELMFEFLNEPHNNLSAIKWNRMLIDLIPRVRETNPDRVLVIGPGDYNSVDSIGELTRLPQDDRNIIVTVHYYSPFQFTHQGASWVDADSDAWLGTTWEGTEEEKAEVIEDFNKVDDWATEKERPVFLGEFGAYSRAGMESRVRWTNFIAREAESRGWSFAYWEFGAGFGAYNRDADEWREPLLNALIPNTKINYNWNY